MRQRKIKWGFQFRIARAYQKPGLYFENIMDNYKEGRRISEKDIIEIRDFLSRYINKHIHQKDSDLEAGIRMKARAIERAALKLEANK